MGKNLLNLAPSEPLALVKKFPCFDDPVVLYVLLVGSFQLCIHDEINYVSMMKSIVSFSRKIGLSSVGAKCSATSKASSRGGKYG
jgi:hypothetical protein